MNLLNRAVEDSILARKVVNAIILRKGHLHIERLADLGADQLVLETGNELVGAKLQPDACARTTLKGDIVNLALEIDDNNIALCSRTGCFNGFGLTVLLNDTRDRVINLGIRRHDLDPLKFNAGQIEITNLGQDFDRKFELQILARIE